MVNSLKPCPFCGSRATVYKEYQMSGQLGEGPIYMVSCSKLCVVMKSFSRDVVIEKWNHRVRDED